MQKFSNMPLSEVASAAVPAARRVAVPTAKPASLSAEALNIPRSGIRDVFDRVERVPDAISLTVGVPTCLCPKLHLLLCLLPGGLLCRPPSPRACPPKP